MKKSGIPVIHILLLLAAITFVSISSCKKTIVKKFYPSRMFTPTGISVSGGDTAVTISWPATLNAPTKGVSYTLEINTDSSFKDAPVLSLTVDTIAITITDDTLQDRQHYFARVKANGPNGTSSSYWMTDTASFSLVGVQIFKPLQSSNVIDNAVILKWKTTPGVSRIILKTANGDTTQVNVSSTANAAGQLLISNLKPGTQYTAQILAGRKSKGLLTFTTKEAITGANVIDLRNITGRPEVLYDTLPMIPAGSIVVLARGQTYTIPSTYVFDKTVTIMSGLGFSASATLALVTNFDASGNIDSLRFEGLNIATIGSNYFMNISKVTTIGKLSVVNCTTQGNFSNSFIRMKKGDDKISTLYINNCIIDSVGVASKYAVFYANASGTAVIDNIEIHNSTFYDIYYFVRQSNKSVSASSIKIDHCTFDNMINQGGHFIDYSQFPVSFSITNCILGKTLDPTAANGISSSAGAGFFNCYITSDCIFSGDPITGPTAYSGTSTDLFLEPDAGNFTIKDPAFPGKNSAGDPRWIP